MRELPEVKGNILIVDDEPNALLFMTKIFQPLGYGTVTAQNGLEALNYFERGDEPIDLMLIDLCLPGLDGIEVIRMARKLQPDLPVIVVSGLLDKREDCRAIGVDAFLEKPYSLETLYTRVEAVMKRKGLEVGPESADLDSGWEPCAKILIVDDEPEACELMSQALLEDAPIGTYQMQWALSGEEALRLSSTFHPDIAVVDVKMPGMSGIELIREFKAGRGSAPRDFVIYTGMTDPETVHQAKELGHRVLTKPTDLDSLFEVLKKICVRHHLVRRIPS